MFNLAYFTTLWYNLHMKTFKRKIYDNLLQWKKREQGKSALLIEGARRIGKSTIAETFAKNEYESYILIDFNDCSKEVIYAFNEKLIYLDEFFKTIEYEYNKKLVKRKSLIIFDEVQRFPKARQSIKKLVADGRYDYIETGSLISINENVKDITIPSEEISIKMYPIDFEEFALIFEKENLLKLIKEAYINKTPLDNKIHKDAMDLFKLYIIIGGMPQAINEYIKNGFEYCDIRKRAIIDLYRKDIMKIKGVYRSKVLSLFDQIPAFLSKHEKRIILSNIDKGINTENSFENTIFWLENSMITNNCFKCNDPNIGLGINKNVSFVKCYMGDTGLLLSMAFDEYNITKEDIYRKIMQDKLSLNEGIFYENAIAQMLVSNGHKLYFYTHYNETKKRNDIEIDFLITDIHLKKSLIPIEVKSSARYSHTSLDRFKEKYTERIEKSIIVHPRNLTINNETFCIPPYMVWCI